MVRGVLVVLVALLGVVALDLAEPAAPALAADEQAVTVWMTGYSYQDNRGGNNARICCGVVHRQAGGTGTFDDPITVAVPGHEGRGMQTPAGVRFYAPDLRRYLIVEDSGASASSRVHLDVYVGGEGLPTSASERCMNQITSSSARVIMNPRPGYPVTVGSLTGPNGCRI